MFLCLIVFVFFFFFSSRRRHTRSLCDWSSDVCSSDLRLARAYTGRDKILKFEGGYHGRSDYGLMSLAPKRAGNFPRPIPDSAGIPRSLRDEVLVAPFNDLETVAGLVREHGDELAGIIVEPFQRLIPPKPGFLEGL